MTVRQGQGVTVTDFRAEGTIELLGPFLAHSSDPSEKARVVLDLLEPRARVIDFLVETAARSGRPEDVAALRGFERSVRDAETKRDALAYVTAFIEEAKASGLVRRSLDAMGLKSSQVAPAGMKP